MIALVMSAMSLTSLPLVLQLHQMKLAEMSDQGRLENFKPQNRQIICCHSTKRGKKKKQYLCGSEQGNLIFLTHKSTLTPKSISESH